MTSTRRTKGRSYLPPLESVTRDTLKLTSSRARADQLLASAQQLRFRWDLCHFPERRSETVNLTVSNSRSRLSTLTHTPARQSIKPKHQP